MRKFFIFFWLFSTTLVQSQAPKQLSSSEIYQKIKKLNVLGNVLYLAAHPDDENTRFISYCANELQYNTAYLSLTRGDGGQNLIGPEIREELGIIRTQELLAARRTDGGQQFFSRANDFGYSKTPDETLEIWNKDKILADVVWTIRKFRPDVIVCRFPTDGGGGHGHHTSSALLAKEAFSLAGDKSKYTEQLKYVEPWQPTRVVVNTGRWWNDTISEEDDGVVIEDIGEYNAVLGISYNELAAKSRTMHKSQGFGSTGARGSHIEYFEHLAGKQADDGLFTDNDHTWNRVKNAQHLDELTKKIFLEYDIYSPSSSISSLVKLRREVKKIEDEYWKKIKLKEIDELIIQCAGIYMEAKADDFSKTYGDSLKINFELIQRSMNMEVYLDHISCKTLNYEEGKTRKISYNTKEEYVRDFITPKLPISQPYWLKEKGTLGTYNVSNQTIIRTPENTPSILFTAQFDFGGEKINFDFPLIFKWNDPVKGEQYRPFIITPKVTANIEQPIYLFSSKEDKTVTITVKSHSENQKGILKIEAPEGWKTEYTNTYDFKSKGEELKVNLKLTPLNKPKNGNLKVYLNDKLSYAINTIEYDHIPTQVWFPESSAKLVYVDIVKKSKKIGYIPGAGDVVPDALRNIGYQVDILEEGNLDNIGEYDAIITGIRFFNVNKRSPFMAEKLMNYVKNGGNLVVQYNTRHRMKTQNFGPYPITLSRDRVTEEDAEVIFLKPKHPILNTPNKINQKDFENWVQERGLYFPSQWDEKYEAILSWHDKGEDSKEGSLLVTQYGKGNYVYTGISFFRELPAGVPGAYRLLVNLIELGK